MNRLKKLSRFCVSITLLLILASCTEKQKIEIEKQGQAYIDFIRTGNDDAALQKELFLNFMEVIFQATNNRVLSLMGQIQQVIRELSHISDDEGLEKELGVIEEKSIRMMIDAVNSGDSVHAKELVSKICKVGPKIEEIMRAVPLGRIVTIPADIFLEEIRIED